MGKSLPDSADPSLNRPRFSMGRIARGGAVACLWLWTSAGTLSAAPTAATTYQHALERFNHGDYTRAMDLLEQLPASRDAHVRADRLNLKGAILLRERRNDDARVAFTEAARLDPSLLAAHFNAVEISFREKRYAESRRQFSALLAQMGKSGHTTERRFIEYKLMLASLLDGQEKPALDFIAAHRSDEQPPLAWFYLNAALEYRHGHEARAAAWLQESDTHYTPVVAKVFTDSFNALGWSPRAAAATEQRPAVREERPLAAVSLPTPVVKAALPVAPTPVIPVSVPSASGRVAKQPAVKEAAAQLAVVSLFPDNRPAPAASVPVRENVHADDPRPAFHFDGKPASRPPEVEEMPPSEVGLVTSLNEAIDPAQGASAAAEVFAKPTSGRKGKASPSASPTDGGSTSASPLPSPDATVSPTPKADATPSGTPSPAFVQKYEAATVQFLQKDYPGATKLLDEADAIQGGQPNSVSLRNQIFKAYYEAAYAAYQHAEYPAALTQLDGADAAHSNTQNQSDAYNLRGLVLSKQRNYEGAEAMFHKAVQTDPGLWAAKFNYAEVPFNYRNFTVARARFEELFSQTDPVKQPVEAELTQFKVFLTLLLEGKEDAARTFMQHFNFSGATPARYFCQAALNFYSGDVDKAQGWIDSARKEYPPRKSSSFLEAFYRVGWLTDPNAPDNGARSTAAAAASPSAAPSVSAAAPGPTPATAVAMVSPTPAPTASATPAVSPAVAQATLPAVPAFRVLVTPPPVASATPSPSATLVAKASPTVAPSATPSPTLVAKATPSATPSATLVAKATPSATPTPSATAVLMAKASATPTPPPSPSPTASATPAPILVAKATPSATPAPTLVAKATPSATPSPSVSATPLPALAKATPTPTLAVAKVTPTATPSPSASATVVAAATPKPTATLPAVIAAASPTPARTPTASPTATESPEATPEVAATASEQNKGGGDFLRVLMVGGVAIYFLYVVSRIGLAATGRKSKRGPAADASTSQPKSKEADEVEVKR